ncbi:hypothetical protein AN5927.2 [Aspergillus nidulans FGSC A4]|uniref:Pentatricopeptide repeat protein (AFU_orthologue AFUA_2G10790) n=1 Tax=Emericella nidulans (strain FGSC A4 / ATCC 38163 / CBS 112.46 / NRRL 194 / M139) TaxID=227321 RepID=Q5B0K3_EMENI|nr:hypothetical protein [Aspergillus nidulans FGSC A4]EAA57790.1 hypothetical protein AN5927.2 [Aspergillus nidulans FGSC A4]CBF70550.1 TPA: pentatricopeptide repeat protein (AFU_orthologue; AFUA_2G10790) [Aspergillus nidulans FGSC A4]|eukprot:XP_663531.1 hypothetical protein AN5927.2 [Aspergillus nidulans FGSC A4]
MLRCSNATALRTQFSRNIALRVSTSLDSPWTRLPRRAVSLACATTTRARAGPNGSRSFPAGTSRPYSENSAPEKSTPGNPVLETQMPPTNEAIALRDLGVPEPGVPSGRKSPVRPRGSGPDALMLIAMNKGESVAKKAVEMELAWLKDRTVLAERVQRLLKQDNIAFAAELVRTAQRRHYDTQGAWNAILAYCFGKGHAEAAFRFWNDMKKRGGKPNSFAYTTMLRGMGHVDRTPHVDPMSMARSIYQNMLDPDSPVEPTLIHHNAMMTACGLHGDMNLLWEIAGSLPEEGPGSPDVITYTIILNSLRRQIQRQAAKLGAHEYGAEKTFNARLSAIAEGKRIWSDVVYRWQKGELEMEKSNELVSSMAGLLWEGTGDWHLFEVLKLMHQTTGIPILAKEPSRQVHIGSRRAHSRQGTPLVPEEREDVPLVDRMGRKLEDMTPKRNPEPADELEKEEEGDYEHVFDSFLPSSAKPYAATQPASEQPELMRSTLRKSVYSRPAPQQPPPRYTLPKEPEEKGPRYMPIGNRELSIIMETCLQMTNAVQSGKAYWNHLTKEDNGYRITPDRRSFIGYLRILRVARQSRLSLEVIREQMIPQGIESGLPFHIAMSTCRRDRNNLNVFKHANDLLKLMDESLMIPDHRAMSSYLDLLKVLEDNPQLLMGLNGLDPSKQSNPNFQHMRKELVVNLQTVAADNLRPLVSTLDDALEASLKGRPDLSGRHGVDPELLKLQKVSGDKAVAVLARIRSLLVAILMPNRENILPKEDRERFEKDELLLRKYTKADVIENFRKRMIYPTAERQDLYYKRFKPQNENIFEETDALTVY